jgi:hypothetical protein
MVSIHWKGLYTISTLLVKRKAFLHVNRFIYIVYRLIFHLRERFGHMRECKGEKSLT